MNTALASRPALLAPGLLLLAALVGCGDADPAPKADAPKADAPKPAGAQPASFVGAPPLAVEPLVGAPRPSLLLAHAWFYKDDQGKPKPGPARLDIWRPDAEGTWTRTRLEDPDSNVFHKAIAVDGGILTIGAESASLKLWRFADGKWTADTLWTRKWEGKFNRLRDVEVADVDGDGKVEYIIATHDAGVVAVVNPAEGGSEPQIIEMDEKADTFVHEIEVGDVDGDGRPEFFATPTDRNVANASQGGMMVMYRWTGDAYERSVVDPMGHTHAKEILAADLDGDGLSELFSVLEAETDDARNIVKPVEVRQYARQPDGSFTHSVLATINDRQTRFLVPGDFDGDGKQELVAAAMKSGLYHLRPPAEEGGAWTVTRFDQTSSGFEHAAYPYDLDGDGKLELYVAADDQRELRRYDFNVETGEWKKTLLGRLDESVLTWNITAATL